MLSTYFAALTCALAALAASGCGKSGSSASTSSSSTTATAAATTSSLPSIPTQPVSDPTTPPESRSAYVAKMNAICLALSARRTKVGIATPAEVWRVGTALAAYERSATIPQMEKLSPPASLVSDWKKIIDAARALPVYTLHIAETAHTTGQTTKAAIGALVDAHLTSELKAIAIAKRDRLKTGWDGCLHQI